MDSHPDLANQCIESLRDLVQMGPVPNTNSVTWGKVQVQWVLGKGTGKNTFSILSIVFANIIYDESFQSPNIFEMIDLTIGSKASEKQGSTTIPSFYHVS